MNAQCKIYLSLPSSSSFIWPYNFYIIDENLCTLKVLKGIISAFQEALERHVLCNKMSACTGASRLLACVLAYI